MPIVADTVTRAKKLIKDEKISHGVWVAPKDSDRDQADCLAPEKGFPIIKDDTVFARGVGNAMARSAPGTQGADPEVYKAASELSGMIHETTDKEDEMKDKPDAAASGSWSNMSATGPDGKDCAMSVQADGAIGKDVASKVCPPGSKCNLKTHEGDRSWMVVSHEPHAHANMTTPQLAQMSGPPVPNAADVGMAITPGKPMHTMAHVAQLHQQSADWGHSPKLSFTAPGQQSMEGDKGESDVAADDEMGDDMMPDTSMSDDQAAARVLGLA